MGSVIAVVLLVLVLLVAAGLALTIRRRRRPAPGQPRTVADLVRMRGGAAVTDSDGGADTSEVATAAVVHPRTPVDEPDPAVDGNGTDRADRAPDPVGAGPIDRSIRDRAEAADRSGGVVTEAAPAGVSPASADTPWARAARMAESDAAVPAARTPRHAAPLRPDRDPAVPSRFGSGWPFLAPLGPADPAPPESAPAAAAVGPAAAGPVAVAGLDAVLPAPAGGDRAAAEPAVAEVPGREPAVAEPVPAGSESSPAAATEPPASRPDAPADPVPDRAAVTPAAPAREPAASEPTAPVAIAGGSEAVAPVQPAAGEPDVDQALTVHPAAADAPVAEPATAEPSVAEPAGAAAPIVEAASDRNPLPFRPPGDPTSTPARTAGRVRRHPADTAAEQAAADLALLRTFGVAGPGRAPEPDDEETELAVRATGQAGPAFGAAQEVRVHVVGRTGDGLAGAAVTLHDHLGRETASVPADVEGRATLTAPNPGGYVLVAVSDGHQPGAAALTVDDAPVEAEIVLTRSATLSGTVTGEDGPQAGARVVLVQDGETLEATTAGPDGGYRFGDLTAGEYGLSVTVPDCEPVAVLVHVSDEEQVRRDIELDPAGLPDDVVTSPF